MGAVEVPVHRMIYAVLLALERGARGGLEWAIQCSSQLQLMRFKYSGLQLGSFRPACLEVAAAPSEPNGCLVRGF